MTVLETLQQKWPVKGPRLMKIFKEKAGILADDAVWVCMYPGYLHADARLIRLFWEVLTEYKSDKHLIG